MKTQNGRNQGLRDPWNQGSLDGERRLSHNPEIYRRRRDRKKYSRGYQWGNTLPYAFTPASQEEASFLKAPYPNQFEGAAEGLSLLNSSDVVRDIPEDDIHHPSHYTSGKIEVWDFIIDQDLGYLLGNIVKYVTRAGKKTPDKLKDLKKARAYINKAISEAQKEND